MRIVSSFLALQIVLGSALAQETAVRPGTPEAVADRFLAALEAGDEAAQGALASPDGPDPWLVAEVLLARERRKAALLFAELSSGPTVRALPGYVRGAEPESRVREHRAALDAALPLLAGGSAEDALSRLPEGPVARGTMVGVRLQMARGHALRSLGRIEKSAELFEAAAERAEEIGWREGASEALYRAGTARHSNAEFPRALKIFRRRLRIEKGLGSQAGMGRVHFGISVVHDSLGENLSAAEHLAQARRLAEESGDFEYLGKVYANSALAASRRGETREAMSLTERSLEALGRAEGQGLEWRFRPDLERILRSRIGALLNLASWSGKLADIVAARDYLGQAVTEARESGDAMLLAGVGAHRATFEGVWHEIHQEDLEALAQFQAAYRLYDDAGDLVRATDAQRRVAAVKSGLGDFPAALESLEVAVDVLEEIGARREEFRARLEAGRVCLRLGRSEDALRHIDEALALARFMGESELEAEARIAQARYFLRRAEYVDALRSIKHAFKIREVLGNVAGLAHLEVFLGTVHSDLGDLPRALEHTERAIRAYVKLEDSGNLEIARAQQAELWVRTGRFEEAAAVLGELGDRQRRRKDRVGLARSLSALADIHFSRGRFPEAVEVRTEVLGLRVAMGDRTGAVAARGQLGRELFFSGKEDQALQELQAAWDEGRDLPSPWVRVWCSVGLAEACFFREDYEAAAAWSRRGIERMSGLGAELADSEAAAFRAKFAALPEIGAAASLHLGRLEDAYAFIERGRSAALLAALGGRRNLREVTVTETLLRAEEEARGREVMALARMERARGEGRRAEIQKCRAELDATREGVRAAVLEIEREERSLADLAYPSVLPLADLQKSLAETEALVLFADLLELTVALVITGEEVRAVRLGGSEEVARETATMWGEEGRVLDPEGLSRARRLLLDPLDLPEGVTRLLMSPHAGLSGVSFGLLAKSREVVFVPSGTAYGILREADPGRGTKVLAFGEPDYPTGREPSGVVASARRGSEWLVPLPGTGREVREVGDVIALGPRASETEFRARVFRDGPWRAVHLACHARLDPKKPTLTSLALSADAKNDGFLTAIDVLRLKIPAELVVLSACETGLGQVIEGEGIRGLARAFMLAGAPRVLCSLWKVDDEATMALMVKFYELWNPAEGEGLPAATALKRAQEFVRGHEKWKHPYYWAAWVLWGLPS